MTKLIPDLDEASKKFVFWLTKHKCYLKVSVDYLCKNTNSLNESEELKQDLKEVNLKKCKQYHNQCWDTVYFVRLMITNHGSPNHYSSHLHSYSDFAKQGEWTVVQERPKTIRFNIRYFQKKQFSILCRLGELKLRVLAFFKWMR